ncbi:hypothetical protein PP175_00205 [Aneurinibacillus sp. Ricciae_BoGa-3]|uniref:hypothetical protein n=1 Tax=Aneurinibacillus sp. Ricciae_BoGa-3 TaxID=3022697 RepID=UPI002341E686|nr:hypothetical protein [Aneurinibacillus sp. Ricciae_BoGa-3]WCK54548.1 hypothetical protein PP175_00205 [Aneurinibacillus sp. Ricciae_BoGa-3]
MSHDKPRLLITESLSTRSLARILDDFEDTNVPITVVLDDITLIGTVKEVERGLLTLTVISGGPPAAAPEYVPIEPLAFIPIDKILFVENIGPSRAC